MPSVPQTRSLLLVLALASCTGAVNEPHHSGDDDTPGGGGDGTGKGGAGADVVVDNPPAQAATARVRRLSAVELRNTIEDVFPGPSPLPAGVDRPGGKVVFENQFDQLSVPLPVAEGLQALAEAAGARVSASLGKLLTCGETADCAKTFITSYGRRLFRRPLQAAEVSRYLDLYASARAAVDHRTAVGALAEAMLQSPHFLFRTEMGDPAAPAAKAVPLTQFELASELAFMLWASGPDEALLDAAADGNLATAAAIEKQALRMLEDPRSERGLRHFFLQWIGTSTAATLGKNTSVYPDWTPALAKAAAEESARFFDHVMWKGDGKLTTLLTSNETFANAELARLYRLQATDAPKSADFSRVSLDKAQRSGFLTQAAFLAAHTPAGSFSPVNLGHFVRRRMFCQVPPPPPANVPPAPEPDAGVSTRDRFAQHLANPSCAGCHQLMDPIGFGFEQIDPIGRFRTKEEDKFALTGQGELLETDVDGSFRGAPALAANLARSEDVQACVAAHVLEYALGRDTSDPEQRTPVDETAIKGMLARLQKSGQDLKQLFVSVASSHAFRLRDTTSIKTGGSI